MEDSRAVFDRTGWDAVHVRDSGGRMAALRQRRKRWIDAGVLIVGAVAAHAAIGYFGWTWISSHRAPSAAATVAPVIVAENRPTTLERKPAAPAPVSDRYSGTMQWTRRDGLTIEPEKSAEWKCVGGFYFTMKKDAAGTTVVEGVIRNRQPVRC